VGAIVLAVVVYFAVVAARRDRAALVAETSEVVLALRRLDGSLWQAESGQRGYLLTHDERYLEPYRRALTDIAVALDRVQARTAHDRGLRGRNEQLVALVDAKLAELRRGLAARDERGLREALQLVGSGEGAGLMEQIAGVRAELEAAERAALGGRWRAWSGSIALTDAVFLGACALILALIGVAGFAVRSELRAREERERERRRMLELQERLLGIVGHDLRNPLSSIVAGVTLLSRAELSPPEARTAARILSSSRRMARMVRDLLDWTRGRAAGGIPVRRRAADLGEICRAVVDEATLRHGGAAVELEREGDLSGEWDPDRLEQAIENLVSNALQYAPVGVPVRVRAAGEADTVRLAVENDGPPIAPEVMGSMFDPFRRGRRTEEGGGDGLGLGLFIVRCIAEAHDGSVEVDSGPSRPVRFTVVLPRGDGARGRRTPSGSWRRTSLPDAARA
jgi:signal transduction histidine kinase